MSSGLSRFLDHERCRFDILGQDGISIKLIMFCWANSLLSLSFADPLGLPGDIIHGWIISNQIGLTLTAWATVLPGWSPLNVARGLWSLARRGISEGFTAWIGLLVLVVSALLLGGAIASADGRVLYAVGLSCTLLSAWTAIAMLQIRMPPGS